MPDLAAEPRAPGSVKLQGEGELYRVRAGDYRIVYQIQDAVLVVQIGHRREIYRQYAARGFLESHWRSALRLPPCLCSRRWRTMRGHAPFVE